MSDTTNLTRPGSKLGRYKFVWLLLLLPLVILLVIFLAATAYRGIPEWKAAQANRTQFEQWAAAGVPYDNATLLISYNERTHPEGTPDWIESSRLVNWGSEVEAYKQLPYLGYERQDPTNLVASYLKEMEPVIDLIERASSHPTPVRFPIEFQGVDILLPHIQDARKILLLLSLDCDFAYFKQDNERALRDLSLMKATAEAYDDRACLVSGLVNVALRSMRKGALRRTLTHCQWSETELEALRDSLASKEEISARWQDIMFHERAFGLSILGEPSGKLAQSISQEKQFERRFNIFNVPSEVQTLMKVYQRMIDLPIGPDVSKWRQRADGLEGWLRTQRSNSLAGMLAPSGVQCLEAEIRTEDERRWTLTAVAIQQFKQQHERWPKRLAELESVGLKYEDYSDMEKIVFGYEIEGDRAFLWKKNVYCSSAGNQISKTRPLSNQNQSDVSSFVVELN